MADMPPEGPEAVVAANVRRLREALGLSQNELARRAAIGNSDMAVWGIENGKRRVNVADMYALADVLGVTVNRLLAPGAAEEVGSGAQRYEITYRDGVTETVLAFRREVADGWMNFYYGGELVYSGAVHHMLGIRLKQGAES